MARTKVSRGISNGELHAHEVIGVVSPHEVGCRHSDHEIGLPQLGSLWKSRRPGKLPAIAERRTLVHPTPDELDLLVGEDVLARKMSKANIRGPWRHVFAGRHRPNQLGPRCDVLVAQKWEGTCFAWPVTLGAAGIDYRGNVLAEGNAGGQMGRSGGRLGRW